MNRTEKKKLELKNIVTQTFQKGNKFYSPHCNFGIPLVQFLLRRLGTPRANWVTDSFALAINLVIKKNIIPKISLSVYFCKV
jgi:hypothetical protein